MKKDNYKISDEEISNISELLGELPKVNAPDNFEFNLMTKIENGAFDLKTNEKSSLPIWAWITSTSVVVATTAVILFFGLNLNDIPEEDPLQNLPVLQSAGVPQSESGKSSFENSSNIVNNNTQKVSAKTSERYVVTLQPNDVIAKKKAAYPFNKKQSIDLDNVLSDPNQHSTYNPQLRAVSHGGINNDIEFNGFEIKTKENKEVVDKLKAKMDSSWRAKQKLGNKK